MSTDSYIERNHCNMCGSSELKPVFGTPDLPLTGLYFESKQQEPSRYDQEFMHCSNCGHGQLRYLIAPEVLYDQTYTHRSSASSIATSGNDFFLDFIRDTVKDSTFDSILEIGCNDKYLLSKIQDLGSEIVGIDPIWKDQDHTMNEKTAVLGKFVEELEPGTDFKKSPNLVLSAHTFEHIGDFHTQMERLCELTAPDALFCIEVPGYDSMLKIERFDQVFHQHIQYTSLSSMQALVERLGCSYLGHRYNYGYWGGTFMFAFKKGSSGGPQLDKQKVASVEAVQEKYQNYLSRVRLAADQMQQLNEPCYAFGAAQMLPILAYHMESDLSFCGAIIDDNPDRADKYLPYVAPQIKATKEIDDLSDAAVMVTALDSQRPILKRLIDLKPRRIVSPIQVF